MNKLLQNFKNIKKTQQHTFLFFIFCVTAFVFFHVFDFLFQPAVGEHLWRQADSLSFVKHYLMNDFAFFQPGNLNLASSEARVAAEFPFFYYITAWLTKIFGNHDFLLRWVYFLIIITGLFSLSKCILPFVEKHFSLLYYPFYYSLHQYSFTIVWAFCQISGIRLNHDR